MLEIADIPRPRVVPLQRIDDGSIPALLIAVREAGYTPIGPTVRDGAIVYDEVRSAADLPRGWTDVQDAGTYALRRRDDDAWFGFAVGPHSWKRFLFPPALRVWSVERDA